MFETVDLSAVPKDPRQRLLRVPIPKDVAGRLVIDRATLEPEHRKGLKAVHRARVEQNIKDRLVISQKCEEDQIFRAKMLKIVRESVVDFINFFVWTFDPREDVAVIPFVLYEDQEREARFFQDEFLPARSMTWMDEKSRAWGWTWKEAATVVWAFLFRDNFSCLIGAANQDDIDDGGIQATHESIFGKIRFILQYLPGWMIPGDLNDNANLNKIFTIKHPHGHNVIQGRQYCANWGRGKRFTVALCDEFAWSDSAEAAAVSFNQTSPRIHVGSTPHGRDNEFGRMRFGETKKIVHTLFWASNPNLDTDWYWEQRDRWGTEKIAQELDIDYDRSTSSAILLNFDPDKIIDDTLDYDPNLPLVVAVDPGFNDPFAVLWIQPHKMYKEYRIIDFVQYEKRDGEFLVPFLIGHVPKTTFMGKPWPYEYDEFEMSIIRRHAKWGMPDEAVGDSYGAAAGKVANFSVYDLWEEYKFPAVYPVKIRNKEEAVSQLVAALPRIRLAGHLRHQRTQSKVTPTLVECFQHYSWVDQESPSGRKLKREPKHNVYCHAMDALQQYLDGEDVIDPDLTPINPDWGGRDRWGTKGAHNPGATISPNYDRGEECDPISK